MQSFHSFLILIKKLIGISKDLNMLTKAATKGFKVKKNCTTAYNILLSILETMAVYDCVAAEILPYSLTMLTSEFS
jgi:hypothetical protein